MKTKESVKKCKCGGKIERETYSFDTVSGPMKGRSKSIVVDICNECGDSKLIKELD